MEEKRTYRTDFYTPDDVMKILHIEKTAFENWLKTYSGKTFII